MFGRKKKEKRKFTPKEARTCLSKALTELTTAALDYGAAAAVDLEDGRVTGRTRARARLRLRHAASRYHETIVCVSFLLDAK